MFHSYDSAHGLVGHGNETSDSVKDKEFLDYLTVLLAFRGGLCTMGLVS